jgi:SAM-dependent methyltransferase
MPLRKAEVSGAFASVYDTLYSDPEFISVRSDFLCSFVGPRDTPLLDAGCGTGAQTHALSQRGYPVVGLDLDPSMLAAARERLPGAPLVCADLRYLPFPAAFGGILCLESPLAYLLDDADFRLALRSLRSTLLPRGRLILDTFDYAAALGTGRIRPRQAAFGPVRVSESHLYDLATRVWTMRQRLTVAEVDGDRRFEVKHRLKLRAADEYAAALEAAGFDVLQMLPGYPGLPEPRIVVVAQAA